MPTILQINCKLSSSVASFMKEANLCGRMFSDGFATAKMVCLIETYSRMVKGDPRTATHLAYGRGFFHRVKANRFSARLLGQVKIPAVTRFTTT